MLDPPFHKARINRCAGVRRVVAGDRVAVGRQPVATIGPPAIGLLLCAILGDAKATGHFPALGRPADERHGQQRLGASAAILLDKAVGGGTDGQLRRGGILVGDVFKEPVTGAIGRVQLPVVARGRVATPAAHRQVDRGRQRFIGIVDTVNLCANGSARSVKIDGEMGAGHGRWRRPRRQIQIDQRHVIEIKGRLGFTRGVLPDNAADRTGGTQVGQLDLHWRPGVGFGNHLLAGGQKGGAFIG